MISLRRGTVSLVPYDSTWANEFDKEKAILEQAFGDKVLAIEHVGSTAVPGLAAKPIIDIEIGLEKFDDYKELVPLAESVGYQFMPDRIFDEYVLMPKGSEDCRTHYLHFAVVGSDEWNNVIGFRNILRSNSRLRDEYADVKAKLASANTSNRAAYTVAKSDFIERALSAGAHKNDTVDTSS